jgi:hypothetical protein
MATAWQTVEVPEPDSYDPTWVAADLGRCRQRGLDRLDRNSSNQAPVHAGELRRLAEAHAAATGSTDTDRITQIKALLIAGIDDLRHQDRRREADLIRDLFFGESADGPIGSPGDLLRVARRKAFDMADTRFDEWRGNALRSFAAVLIAHVTGLPGVTATSGVQESHGQMAIIGQAGDTRHFVQLLARADKATIVGITNEDLLPMLQEALRLKRESSGRPDDFWDSLRIVFQSMNLLVNVSDERLRLSDPAEALRQRKVAADWARRGIGVFLKRTGSTKWAIYESPYQPVLTGTFLEFSDGSKIAHLLLRRPLHPRDEQTYLDIPDPRGQVGVVFDEIVYTSKSDTMVVPVGEPAIDSAFRCYGSRLQSEVLKDGSRAGGWLPMILIVTFRHYRGHVEPILQLRTIENSAREENRLSHIGGHIQEEDRRRPGGRQLADPPTILHLGHEVPIWAAQRIFRQVTGAEPAQDLKPVTVSGYFYPDKESLFFFVYAVNVAEGLQYPLPAEMQPFGLDQLLAVRASQALASAVDLCRRNDITRVQWEAAIRVAALNLTLHDQPELAGKLLATVHGARDDRAALATSLDRLVVRVTAASSAPTSGDVTLAGLAGWQYRHFFSDLLPVYFELGVDGAEELLQSVTEDPAKRAANLELADLYQDEHLMSLLPMEL